MRTFMKKAGMFLLLASVLAALSGCDLLFPVTKGTDAKVFAVETKNGSVYEIDTGNNTAAAMPLLSIGQNAAGEMRIHGTKAFVAVGSYNNDAPGLYWFDLSLSQPIASRIGEKISAQYLVIQSDTKGYVTSADFAGVYNNAVYPFNPSNPSQGFEEAVSGFGENFYPQDITFVSDGNGGGRIFVADNGESKIYRLNAGGTEVDLVFSASAGGTTGLLPGEFNGNKGVFVANSGGYDASWNPLPGSIDFIPLDADNETALVTVQPNISASRLAAFDSSHLVVTHYGSTWIINLAIDQGQEGRLIEVKAPEGISFGSTDIDICENKAFVPDGALAVYAFDKDGNCSKIDVGKTTEMITNVAVRP